MDGSEVLRAVRRRQAWSQRELARRSGVSASTVAAIEAGQRQASLAVLDAVLAAAGLELAVNVAVPEVPPATRAWLGLSLTRRLYLAVGGSGMPPRRNRTPLWGQLLDLAGRGSVVLHADTAAAVWLRPAAPLTSLDVCYRAQQTWPCPATPDVRQIDACGKHAAAGVSILQDQWVLHVDPPADLALLPEHAGRQAELRAVARLLHQAAPQDLAARRPAAHKDADHLAEQNYVFHTKRYGHRPMPDSSDTRGWRVRDDASLAAWLLRHGYPA